MAMQPLLRHSSPFFLTLGRDPAWSLFNAGLAGAGAAALLLAVSQHWGPPVWWAAPLVPLMAAAWWRWAAPLERRLRWDGQCWQLQADTDGEIAVRLTPVLDFDHWILLQVVRPGWRSALVPRHLAMSRRMHAAEWDLLRATLYAEQSIAHPSGAVTNDLPPP